MKQKQIPVNVVHIPRISLDKYQKWMVKEWKLSMSKYSNNCATREIGSGNWPGQFRNWQAQQTIGLCNIIGLQIYCNILVSNTYCNTFFRIAIYCVLSFLTWTYVFSIFSLEIHCHYWKSVFTAVVFQNLLYWKQTHDLYVESVNVQTANSFWSEEIWAALKHRVRHNSLE